MEQAVFDAYGILAVSTAHLKRLYAPHVRGHSELVLAEAIHWQYGLRMYQAQLAGKTELPNQSCTDFDSIVGATILVTIFTFALDDRIPIDSFTSGNAIALSHAPSPMAMTGGFRALPQDLGDGYSKWIPVLEGSDDEHGSFSDESPGTHGLPEAFLGVCELDDDELRDYNPYHKILRQLAPLLRLAPSPNHLHKLLGFSGRTWVEFRPLLERKDQRALLLFAWWLALLRQVDEWWITTRARTACMAVVHYLCATEDPRVQALLEYPASPDSTDYAWIWEKNTGQSVPN